VTVLVPLVVALPLIVAAAIAAVGHFLSRHVFNLIATAVAAAVTVLCTILIFRSANHDLVYWFGGWRPRHGIAIGIAFTVDPFGAALAALAGVLTTAALVFSYHYFEEVGHLYYTLMLIFLGALVGFAMTGDLFNLFVFFELMSVAAYALTGYRVEQPSVLQGALNFAITNSIGAFMVLIGIALVYGRTGALNLAQIGEVLAGRRADGLVIGSLVLLTVGFLIKAGAVPFHFWLSDAYAVAPAPVGVLLTGVMSDLGYHAVARIYWQVFSGPAGAHPEAVRGLLVAIGVATALVGGVMCLLEADLKRVLAFLTVSHGGVFLVGIGLLRAHGLAGSSVYVVADGLLKGALFLAIGAVQNKLGSSDELWLRGRGRTWRHAPLGILFAACGLGLATLPPFGPFLAHSLIDEAAAAAGLRWLPPLLALATALSAAAVLRAAGRIFLGLGAAKDPLLASQPDEPEEGEQEAQRESRWLLLGPAVALAVAGFGLGLVPGLAGHADHAAARAVDRAGQAAEVLHGRVPPPAPAVASWHSYTGADWGWGAASVVLALALALLLLYRRRVPGLLRRLASPGLPAIRVLHAVHSGAIGDYAAWVAAGTALFAVVWGSTLR
jgi:multicomponent Na+:H+ antiporter subunit D